MSEHSHEYQRFSGAHDCFQFLSIGGRVCVKNISGRTLEFGSPAISVLHGQSIAICLDSKGVNQAIKAKMVTVHGINEGLEVFSLENKIEEAIEEVKEKSTKKQKNKSEDEVTEKVNIQPEEESFATVAPSQQEESVQLSSTQADTDTEQN
jgi:glutamate synthase domain-containing protein 3